MKTKYLEKLKWDWVHFLQERTHYVCQKLYQSKVYNNLEKAKEKAEQELREKLGEEGWEIYLAWRDDYEDVYSLSEGLFHDEHYLLGFRDGLTSSELASGSEPFFSEQYENIDEIIKTGKRLNKAGRDFRKKLGEEEIVNDG